MMALSNGDWDEGSSYRQLMLEYATLLHGSEHTETPTRETCITFSLAFPANLYTACFTRLSS